MYSVFYSSQAEKSFLRLSDKKLRLRIKKVLDSLRINPRKFGVIKLQGVFIAPYRLRVGEYRILFEINDKQHQILIFDIRKRDEKTYL